MTRFRHFIRFTCLGGFLLLLALVSVSGLSPVFPDIFLRLDPALMLIPAVSARAMPAGLIPAGIVLPTEPLIGRIFCGYICPMGIALDGTDRLSAPIPGRTGTGV